MVQEIKEWLRVLNNVERYNKNQTENLTGFFSLNIIANCRELFYENY